MILITENISKVLTDKITDVLREHYIPYAIVSFEKVRDIKFKELVITQWDNYGSLYDVEYYAKTTPVLALREGRYRIYNGDCEIAFLDEIPNLKEYVIDYISKHTRISVDEFEYGELTYSKGKFQYHGFPLFYTKTEVRAMRIFCVFNKEYISSADLAPYLLKSGTLKSINVFICNLNKKTTYLTGFKIIESKRNYGFRMSGRV